MTTSDKRPRRTAKAAKTPKAADAADHPEIPAVVGTTRAAGAAAAADAGAAADAVPSGAKPATKKRGKSGEPRIKDISVSVTSRYREDRHASIALAAYFRSESRGFAPGHEMEDWLAAEEEVDQRLLGEGRAS